MKLKPEEFELLKDSKIGRNVYAKIYTKKSGKVKCRVSFKSPKDTIPTDELVDENFEGSCILRLYYYYYLGSSKSITLSVEEIPEKRGISWSHTLIGNQIPMMMSNQSLKIHYNPSNDRDYKRRVLVKINTLGAPLWCTPRFMYDRKSKSYNSTINYIKRVKDLFTRNLRIPNEKLYNKLWRL